MKKSLFIAALSAVVITLAGCSERVAWTSGMITEEEAKQTAMSHAGFSADQITFTKSKLDVEDGVTVYEVEFKANGSEYEYEIDATTGNVIKSEIDND